MICATIANFAESYVKEEATGKRKYWEPSEFIPDPLKEVEAKVEKKQTPEEIAAILSLVSRKDPNGKKRKVRR